MKKERSKVFKRKLPYFKIISLAIIIFVLLYFGISASKNNTKLSNSSNDNLLEVVDSNGQAPADLQSTSEQILGPAKVNDMIGNNNSASFNNAPSTEELLKGKEIEIAE